MKRRVNALIALFFIITTFTTSLHELMPHHNSSDCQVCTMVQNDNGLEPEESVAPVRQSIHFDAILLPDAMFGIGSISTFDARAPPSLS